MRGITGRYRYLTRTAFLLLGLVLAMGASAMGTPVRAEEGGKLGVPDLPVTPAAYSSTPKAAAAKAAPAAPATQTASTASSLGSTSSSSIVASNAPVVVATTESAAPAEEAPAGDEVAPTAKPAKAASVIPASLPAANAPAAHTLGISTGSRTGTYYNFGNDIKDVLKKSGLTIDVKESAGSIENINRLGARDGVTFGIVQSDVLGFLLRSKEGEAHKIAEDLRMIFPFYNEEVHVIANKSIRNFSELNGKSVVVGPKGSGSWLTSVNLLNISQIQPAKMLRMTPEEGMVAVLSGKADAMIYVGGKPVKLFQNLDSLSNASNYSTMLKNIHLVPLSDPALLKEYGATVITHRDYDFVDQDVPTLSVTAVLVSYGVDDSDSARGKERCEDVRKFSKALADQVGTLQRTGHPKWQEVNLQAEVGFWKRDKCSISGATASVLENELLDTVRAPRDAVPAAGR